MEETKMLRAAGSDGGHYVGRPLHAWGQLRPQWVGVVPRCPASSVLSVCVRTQLFHPRARGDEPDVAVSLHFTIPSRPLVNAAPSSLPSPRTWALLLGKREETPLFQAKI